MPTPTPENENATAKLSLAQRTNREDKVIRHYCDISWQERYDLMREHAEILERETNCLRGTLRLVAMHADFSQCPPEVEPAVDAALLPPNIASEP